VTGRWQPPTAIGQVAGIEGYDPFLGLLVAALASLPVAVATLVLARRWGVERGVGTVALLATLATVGGVAGGFVATGFATAVAIGLASVHAGVQLAAAAAVGRRMLRRMTACSRTAALDYALAGLPLGNALVAVALLVPNGGLRASLSAVEGLVGLAAWLLTGLLVLLTPGVAGVWLYRLRRWLS
jgi:hypothetical protein